MKLIYIADPMCSWCYGFGKELSALMQQVPEIELDIRVGGLRAGATDVLDEKGKQFRLTHWARVEEASGLPFNRKALMERENFIYDTEPVCRAFVTAREFAPRADLLAVFHALQVGFYVDGLDTTDGKVLAHVAADALTALGHAINEEEFYAKWNTTEAIAATRQDFVMVRAAGIRSFPTLLMEVDGEFVEVSPGYAPAAQLAERLSAVMA